MNTNQLHKLTSPSNEMPGDVFDSLLKVTKLSILNENDFEYRGKFNNYEIGFGLINGNLDVDVFGFNHRSEWIELEPTNGQYSEMLAKIKNTVIEKEYCRMPWFDEMWQNGHKPEDFY